MPSVEFGALIAGGSRAESTNAAPEPGLSKSSPNGATDLPLTLGPNALSYTRLRASPKVVIAKQQKDEAGDNHSRNNADVRWVLGERKGTEASQRRVQVRRPPTVVRDGPLPFRKQGTSYPTR